MGTLADLMIKIGINSKGVDQGSKDVQSKLEKTWAGAQKMTAVGGLAIGAALMGGVNQVIQQSKPAALLEAQLGAGTPLAQDAGEAAGAVYARGVVGSMEEATDAVRAIMQNRLVPEDAIAADMEKVASGITTLTQVMGEDVDKASSAIRSMLRNGVADSAEEAFDLLHEGTRKGVNSAGDLLDVFEEYSTQFRELGIDGQQAMGLLRQGLNAGARDADTVADSLKEIAIRAQDGSDASREAFAGLGLDADKLGQMFASGGATAEKALGMVLDKTSQVTDPMEKNAIAVGLFGTKAEDLQDALFGMDLDTAAMSFENMGGAAEKAGNALEQSAGAKLESFKRRAETALVDTLSKAVPYIEATFGWLSRNSDWVLPLATGLGILATAIGVIVAVQWLWNAALALWPGTWIILGILALVGVILYLATKTKFFQTVWEGVWGFLKAVGRWFAGPFANFFVSGWNKVVGKFKLAKALIGIAISSTKNTLKTLAIVFLTVAKRVIDKGNSIVSFFRKMPGRIKGALSRMWDGLWSGFRGVVNRIIGGWNRLNFTIGGGSFAGINIPSASFGTPNIPYLADGGIVPATPGGRLVVVGEGGSDEAVVPLDRGMPALAPKDAPKVVVEITPGGEREFRRWIQRTVRVKGAVA